MPANGLPHSIEVTCSLFLYAQLYDTEVQRFQEWVPSSAFFPAYVRLLYAASNPVLAHPLADLLDVEGSDEDEAGREKTPEEKAAAAFAAAQSGAQGSHLLLRRVLLACCSFWPGVGGPQPVLL